MFDQSVVIKKREVGSEEFLSNDVLHISTFDDAKQKEIILEQTIDEKVWLNSVFKTSYVKATKPEKSILFSCHPRQISYS